MRSDAIGMGGEVMMTLVEPRSVMAAMTVANQVSDQEHQDLEHRLGQDFNNQSGAGRREKEVISSRRCLSE